MTQHMFKLGDELDNGTTTMNAVRESDLLPLHLDGIVSCDQSHARAVPAGGTGQSGSMSRHQYRIAVDKDTGTLKHDGVFPDRRSQIKPKYDSYAQGCYAIAMPCVDGELKPCSWRHSIILGRQCNLSNKAT